MDVGFGTLGEQLQAKPQELAGGTDVRDVLLDNFEEVVVVEHDRAGHDGGGSGVWADENLAGVNIDVGLDSRIAVVGPNGAGKSTLYVSSST